MWSPYVLHPIWNIPFDRVEFPSTNVLKGSHWKLLSPVVSHLPFTMNDNDTVCCYIYIYIYIYIYMYIHVCVSVAFFHLLWTAGGCRWRKRKRLAISVRSLREDPITNNGTSAQYVIELRHRRVLHTTNVFIFTLETAVLLLSSKTGLLEQPLTNRLPIKHASWIDSVGQWRHQTRRINSELRTGPLNTVTSVSLSPSTKHSTGNNDKCTDAIIKLNKYIYECVCVCVCV